jgi:octaprenyl-diphosphate synthase
MRIGYPEMFEVLERKIEQYVNDLNDRDAEMLYRRLPAGKRLRARLILSIAGRTPAAVKTAAIVEMIHAASLLHDDVIDDAYMRRGQPSINAVYGNKTSVMFGDVLYSKAFYELADLDRPVARILPARSYSSAWESGVMCFCRKLSTRTGKPICI